MVLDEANGSVTAERVELHRASALVHVLLQDEVDPKQRARLVRLRLALGYPHALEVEPEHLEELRVWELRRLTQVLAAHCATSTIAWLLYGSLTVVLAVASQHSALDGYATAVFACAAAHGFLSMLASCRPHRRFLTACAWAGLCLPLFELAALRESLALGLLAALPSLFVSLAAHCLSRHTAAR